MRVLVAASHPVVRRGIRQVLMDGCWPCTVQDARDNTEAETLVGREHWDLVVFDLSVVDQPGMASLSRVRNAIGTETPLIAVGMHAEVEFARSALEAGADAFLLAERVDEDLIETVRHVRRGEALMKVGPPRDGV